MYSNELLKKIKKQMVKEIIVLSILACVIIISTTLGMIFMNQDNALLVSIVLSIIDVISLLVMCYISLNQLHFDTIYKKHIEMISSSRGVIIKGVITNVSEENNTISPGVLCKEITFDGEEGTRKYYLLDKCDASIISLNKEVALEVVSVFIKEIKYENHPL